MFRLDGRTAIITGAGSGIGQAIARLFAQQGARVGVVDVDPAAARDTCALITQNGGVARPLTCDVSSAEQVDATMNAVAAELGGPHVLVNNAGVSHVGTIETTSEADFERIMRINVKGAFLCSQAAIRRFHASGGGVILNMSSIAALIGMTDRFAYSVSKGAVHTMTFQIAADYMQKNIRCNAICPARVHTPFVDGYLKRTYPGHEAEMFAKLSAYQPLGRMGKPEEVAALALYLCSDEAAFITGQAFPIDGGVLVT